MWRPASKHVNPHPITQRNECGYKRFPDDVDVVQGIVSYLATKSIIFHPFASYQFTNI